jgi:glycosyltransferase involved in cell wall biosynthesis/peptidoglycan/xylan/chitin deacetylase (PgdA/CDA1 family)
MRILTITNLFPNPLQPQLATFNRNQLKALAAEHDIALIAPIAWTTEFSAWREGGPTLPASRRLDDDGIPIEHPRYWYVPGCMRGRHGRFFRRSILGAFRRALESFRPDLVYATWAYPDGWAAVDLAHRHGLPVVLKVHGSDVLLLEQHPSRRRGTIEALCGADRIVAVSQDLARKVVELGADPSSVHVVYNGVDSNLFRPGSREEARKRLGLNLDRTLLLFVGNLFPVKGLDVVIQACQLLTARRADFELHLIGKGPLRTELERQVEERSLTGRVRFHGLVPNEQLPDWYRAASVFVLPSRSEGVPNVLLEATACGTPYVASNVGGVREIAHLGDGLLVDPEDPRGLAKALDEILSRPSRLPAGNHVGRSHADSARELADVCAQAKEAHVLRTNDADRRTRLSWRQLVRRGLAVLMPRSLFMVRGPRLNRSVCLTFDDGPHPELTPPLLDFLRHENVPATFFLVGQEAEKYPELVRRMAAEGHAIGSHSYSHPKRTELSRPQLVEEVSRGKAVVDRILGSPTSLYRPPNGKVTARDLWWMWRHGLSVVLWNIDPRDFASTTSNQVRAWFADRVLQAGDVVLFHDTHPHALGVLPELVRTVRERGLTFTTVNKWLEKRGS